MVLYLGQIFRKKSHYFRFIFFDPKNSVFPWRSKLAEKIVMARLDALHLPCVCFWLLSNDCTVGCTDMYAIRNFLENVAALE